MPSLRRIELSAGSGVEWKDQPVTDGLRDTQNWWANPQRRGFLNWGKFMHHPPSPIKILAGDTEYVHLLCSDPLFKMGIGAVQQFLFPRMHVLNYFWTKMKHILFSEYETAKSEYNHHNKPERNWGCFFITTNLWLTRIVQQYRV